MTPFEMRPGVPHVWLGRTERQGEIQQIDFDYIRFFFLLRLPNTSKLKEIIIINQSTYSKHHQFHLVLLKLHFRLTRGFIALKNEVEQVLKDKEN